MSNIEKLRILRYLVLAGALAAGAASADAAVKKPKHKPVVEAEVSEQADDFENSKLVIDGNVAKVPETLDNGATLPGETIDAAKAPINLDAAVAAASVPSGVVAPAAKVDISKLPESEIPVLSNVKDPKKAEGGQFARLLATLGVLVVTFAGASYGLKKWMAGRDGKMKQNTRIKILTQHHLAPKKSLLIVQVAGEAILIGMTDQNISMLKTLSLIDDEIPESVPQNFNQSFDHSLNDFEEDRDGNLQHDEQMEAGMEEDFTISGLAEIRDKVSRSVKNMRRF